MTEPRIGYLLSRYPAISHTFFLQEVLGLRGLGVSVETASINMPDRAMDGLSGAEREEAGRTFYVKGGSKLRALLRVVRIAARRPAVVARGIAFLLRVPRLTLRMRVFWMLYLAEALLVGEWMRRENLPHLHVHFGGPVATVGMLTSAAWEVPYSLTIHGPEELQNVDAYHLREKVRQASFVVCISDFCRSQLLQITPVAAWNKFCVVRLGVTETLLNAVPGERVADGPVRLLCVGRLVPEKGQHVLLQALAEVLRRGIAVQLTLAGDGADRESLKTQARELRVAEAVRFAGATSHAETLRMCAEADVFALASFAEGIPVALMEAMALGVPCVSTMVAGIPELIRDGQDGVLVPPGNADALTEALVRLASDPALRRAYGESSRARVRTMYNLSINQRVLANVFREKLAVTREPFA